ncbi:type 1 glycerol-3-phosphate oxidase [Aerococcaceae bacterium DSM 111022]|nr:type 1 glycerol-3-phosphate oxidase [Aerococcaceae bacterium DSM 111022]
MLNFTINQRDNSIAQLKEETFDLVIIGGGITGAGVAIQAAASGLKTALLEMQDFSEGTSSRSTKLVHGGIRYLKQFDVEVVNDTVSERAVVQQIAPHIPKAEQMLLPVYDTPEATFNLFRLQIAMHLYDTMANVKESHPFANRVLNAQEVLQIQPNLDPEGLVGGGLYLDYNNSDTRLVIENIKQAVDDGAIALSHAKVTGFEYDDNNQVSGVKVEDLIGDEAFTINTKIAINTTGPWSDTIREFDEGDSKPAQMRPTKGVHLVIDRSKLPVSQPIYFDTGEGDGRMVFVIPREDKTYFGTTDTDYEGDFTKPQVTQDDVDYLLRIVNRRFPDADIAQSDIESSWAGLRPLIAGNQASDYNGGDNASMSDDDFDALVNAVAEYQTGNQTRAGVEQTIADLDTNRSETALNPSQISRGSDLSTSESGLMTLAGGKITDYRKMAAGAMVEIAERLEETEGRQITLVNSKTYPVSGGRFNPQQVEESFKRYAKLGRIKGLTSHQAQDIAELYGSNTEAVLDYYDEALPLAEKHDLPVSTVMSLLYAIDQEMVYSVSDYLTRRTNYSLFMSEQVPAILDGVAAIIQERLSLTDEVMADQLTKYQEERNEMTLGRL